MDSLDRRQHTVEVKRHLAATRLAVTHQHHVLEHFQSCKLCETEALRQLKGLEAEEQMFEDYLSSLKLAPDELQALETIVRPSAPMTQGQTFVLTEREREVLIWTAIGKTAREVGSILGLSPRTAEAYLRDASKKLGALNRTHAVAKALTLGLIVIANP